MRLDLKSSILLVDDRPENLLTLEAVLSDLGQNVVTASSGREALRRLLDQEFAVILLDVKMPEMDGFETAALIRARERSRHTPLIFITAINKSDAHVFHGYAMGAVDYVFKPFAPEVLRSKVAAFIQLSRQREELQAEIAQRRQAEAEARRLNQELERRVRDRTAELEMANRRLEAEIGERKQLEVALQQRAAELAEADRRKDEFLAMLAHELRNPLAPIQNAVQILALRGPDDPMLRKQRNIIARQATHMARLVDDLLDVSRITRGKIGLRSDQVELHSVIEQALEAARPLIEAREHELRLSLTLEPLPLKADPARLQQVVVNLMNNAAKYMEPGGTIWLTAEREGEWAVLRVRDTGVGIAPDLLPHIFDLFTQADRSLDRSQGGLGIGLTMVDRLVRLHGGQVAAVSGGPGCGSEFVVRLPLAPDGAPGMEAGSKVGSSELLVSTDLPELHSARVLVVDDNVDAAESLAQLLEIWGCHVRVAFDGPTAIQAAIADEPSVVLLDIGLPGMDGYEVARRLREQEGLRNTLLVAVTGYSQQDRHYDGKARLDHHLTKPISPELLRQLLLSQLAEWPLPR